MFSKKRKTVVPPARMEGQFNFSVQQEEEEDNTCFICDAAFTNKANLKRHIESIHNSQNDIDSIYDNQTDVVEDQFEDVEFVEYYGEEEKESMPDNLYDMLYNQMNSAEDDSEEGGSNEEEHVEDFVESIITTTGEDIL